jgi:hypothetical protein
MADHDTTTLVFVRTDSGVVKVPAGQRVPHDVLPGELDRLLAAGSVTEVAEPVADTAEHTDEPVETEAPAKRPRPRKGSED